MEPPKINMTFTHSAKLLLPDCKYENQFLLITTTLHTKFYIKPWRPTFSQFQANWGYPWSFLGNFSWSLNQKCPHPPLTLTILLTPLHESTGWQYLHLCLYFKIFSMKRLQTLLGKRQTVFVKFSSFNILPLVPH